MDKQVQNRVDDFDAFSKKFLEIGYVIRPIVNLEALNKIRDTVIQVAVDILETDIPKDKEFFLNSFHYLIDYNKLNDFRLSIYNKLNSFPWFKSLFYSLAESYIKSLVGNELVIQKRVNLSIQLPNDDSSLLPVHADVWNGDSPYELVMWIPIVNCYDSKSMFILPIGEENKISKSIKSFRTKSSEDLFDIIKGNIKWLDIKYGEVLLFSQNLMHGNIVNKENETRWSMNCRFKSLFSPYSSKKLGEFFEPLSIKPVTKLGMNYKFPKGF